MRYDLAVIGSGAAGFAAAIAARRDGASVVMVERSTPGGTCVNTGCVPSKALLAAAEARYVALSADRFPGLSGTDAEPVFDDLIAGKNDLVETMRAAKYVDLVAEYGWELVSGTARFVAGKDGPVLNVTLDSGQSTQFTADSYVIATGSAPSLPPIQGIDQIAYLTSTTAMELDRLPESLIVVGGGAIGLEQGQLFARLGTRVTIVEASSRLAPFEEPEASQAIERSFADEQIAVHTGSQMRSVRRHGNRVTATVHKQVADQPLEIGAQRLLVATGRRPQTHGLGLDEVDVKTGPLGEIVVDEHLRTSHDRIFAAGDVTGAPQFVYVAAAHGGIAAANALHNAGQIVNHTHLPRVTFTSPAIAAVGMTEAEAVQAGHTCDCRVLPLEAVPRAVINRDTRGMIKLIADESTGRLLGVHAVAEGAGELAAAGVYTLSAGMTVQQLASLWCPYLTMAEGLKLAAQTFTRDVTKLSCCAA